MEYRIILLIFVIASAGAKIACLNYYDIPPADAKLYNYYGTQMGGGNGFPDDVPLIHNIGFSLTLAFLFNFFDSNDMMLQKVYTVFLSLILIPLMFLFLKNWFEIKYSLIGASFVAFDPRIIQNSTLGVTDMLYMVLFMAALVYMVKDRYCLSYLCAGLATITRLEGIILLPILFLLSSKKMPCPQIAVFLVPVLLVGILYVYETGQDNVTYQISREIATWNTATDDIKNTGNAQPLLINRIANSLLYMSWFALPMFIFFIPPSIYFLRKQKMIRPAVLLACLVFSAATGIWAYFDAYDTRYFFHMYPFLCLLTLIAWKQFFPVRIPPKTIIL